MIYYLISALLIALSGCAEGFSDAIIFHYWMVERKIKLNKNFWDYTISYLNKYKNKDYSKGQSFRGRFFVFICDGFHLLKYIQHLSLFSGIALLLHITTSSFSWWGYVLVGVGCWIINRCGFNAIWLLFK